MLNQSKTSSASSQTFGELITNTRWAIRLTWSTAPRLFSAIIVTNTIQSLAPAGLVLTMRGLVNNVVALLDQDTSDDSGFFLWLGLGLILSAILVVANAANTYLLRRLQDELNIHITEDILKHVATLEYAYFEDPRFQDILFRASQSPTPAQSFSIYISTVLKVVTQSVELISILLILAFIEPLLLLLMLPAAVFYLFFQWRLARDRFSERYVRAVKRRWMRYYTKHLTEAELVAESKLLNLAPLFIRQFHRIMSEFRDRDRQLYLQDWWGKAIFGVLATVAVYFAFTRVTLQVLAGNLTVGDLTTYAAATVRLRMLVENLISGASRIREFSLDVSNLMVLYAIQPQKQDTGAYIPTTCSGEIELKQVSFTYPGSKQPVLTEVSLHIKPGETVAVVGENGAGKTTLVKLIARLYDPDQGLILCDNNDLRELSLPYLHRQISFVFQAFGRYEGTVSENIAYGNWDELWDRQDRIEQLAQKAGLQSMIEAMPQGYQTVLGRMFGEYTLSGGQWQQIAIARAFARDSALLILDEPTANLDARAEYDIFKRFKELAEGRTTILISHRFSTVSVADRIIVMQKGCIVEQGTHDELIAHADHYAALFELHRRQMDKSQNR